ncbi:MAG: hypothetical protein R6W88_18295 [Desulfobacterales bacterium]
MYIPFGYKIHSLLYFILHPTVVILAVMIILNVIAGWYGVLLLGNPAAGKIIHPGKYSYPAFRRGKIRMKGLGPLSLRPGKWFVVFMLSFFATVCSQAGDNILDRRMFDLSQEKIITISEALPRIIKNRIILVGELHSEKSQFQIFLRSSTGLG